MKLKVSHSSEPVEVDSFRIEIGENEFLIKQNADGLQIVEVTDDVIRLQPQVANSIVILTRTRL